MLRGADGMPLVEDLFLRNKKAEYVDTYAAVMALRFQGQEETHLDKMIIRIRVATVAVAMAIDGMRIARFVRYDHEQGSIASSLRAHHRVSEVSDLEGYTTPTGIDPKWFVEPTKTCGTALDCHASITMQHDVSAHAHSMDSAPFKVELGRFIRQRGRLAALRRLVGEHGLRGDH
jgi:hypothetical protein